MPWNSPLIAWVPPGVKRLAPPSSQRQRPRQWREDSEWCSCPCRSLWLCQCGHRPRRPAGHARSTAAEAIEQGLDLGERLKHGAVITHMDNVVWGEWVPLLDGLERRLSHGTEAEDDARRDHCLADGLRGCYSKCAERNALQLAGMFLHEAREVDAEVIHGDVGDGDAAADVVKANDSVLELEQLVAAVFKVVHLVAGLVLDDVLFTGGRDVEKHHPTADTLFQVDVRLQLKVGPEVDGLNALVGRAKTVDAAEPLNDPDRVPVDVVVHYGVAILKIPTFAYAVRGNEQVDLSIASEVLGTLF